jgi:hypothetical protein
MSFQKGDWIPLPSYCTRSFTETYGRCAQYGVEAIQECRYWTTQYVQECIDWGWNQVKKCSWWSWLFCVAFAIIVTAVCLAVEVVAVVICVAFTIVELIFCLLWTFVSIIFCLSTLNGGTTLLLTDGTVMMQESMYLNLYYLGIPRLRAGTNRWWKLTPDRSGSYAQGSWSRLADSNVARTAYASAVLADGRVVVCGGEYSDASGAILQDWNNTCEIYDPVADTWSMFASPTVPGSPGAVWSKIGDAPCALLADGTLLLGSDFDSNVAKLDPSTLTWTAMTPRPTVGTSDEDSWVLMPDNTVVAPSCQDSPTTWVYHITGDQWVRGNDLQNPVVDTATEEIGPGLLLYDGTALFLGANEHTAIYNPRASQWSNGPDLPDQPVNGVPFKVGIQDGPASLMVNGNVLVGAGIKVGSSTDPESSPSWFFEFDGTTFNRTNDPPNNATYTYLTRLLPLPNGDVMFCSEDSSSFYAYHSDAAVPQDSFRPVIQACPAALTPGTTIQISGLQFNGLSQAAAYGDDCETATNYPLVRIVNNQSNHVRYCRTFNHTTIDSSGNTVNSMGVATGAAVITTNVMIPADIEIGDSTLYVVANAIPSDPFSVGIFPFLL